MKIRRASRRLRSLTTVEAIAEVYGSWRALAQFLTTKTKKRTPQMVDYYRKRGWLPPETYVRVTADLARRGYVAGPSMFGMDETARVAA